MSVIYEDFPPPGIGNVNGLGVAGRVAFWSAVDTLSSSANFLWDNVNKRFTVTGSSTTTISETYTLTDLSGSNLWYGRVATLAVTPAVDSPSDVAINQNLVTNISGTRSLNDSTTLYAISTKSTTGALSLHRGGLFTLSNTAGTTSLAESVLGQVTASGGTVTTGRAFRAIASGPAGTITNFTGFHVDAPTANVTNAYAFHADDQGLTNYCLHSLGGKNLLSGPLDLMTTIATSQFAFQTLSLSTLAQPYVNYDPNNYASFEVTGPNGGLSISGLTGNGSTPLTYAAIVGSAVLTQPAHSFVAFKADGLGGVQSIGNAEKLFEFNNGGGTPVFNVFGNGDVQLVTGSLGVGMVPVRKLDVKGTANTAGAGTVSNAGVTVTGVGTAFLTDFTAGEYIIANSVQIRVVAVTDDITLTLDTAPAVAWVAQPYTIVKPISRYIDSGNTTRATVYPTGDIQVSSIVTSGDRPSVLSLAVGASPKLSFGFTDSANFHQIRTAGGANLDLMFDVRDGANHFFGVNGLFKTAYNAVIGDSTFADTAPTNGLLVKGRMSGSLGASVAAANDLTLGSDGNTFFITGNTQINAITTSEWKLSSDITLIFTGTPTIKHNTAGGAGTAKIKLDGEVDLVAANGMVLVLVFDGSDFRQKCPASYTGA